MRLPDGSRILSSHSGDIQIFKDKLPRSATKSYIFPDLKQSLISVPLLCDAGCIAIFSKNSVQISLNDTIILNGTRHDSLWFANIPDIEGKSSNSRNLPNNNPSFLLESNSIFNIIAIKNNRQKMIFTNLYLDHLLNKRFTTHQELDYLQHSQV